MCNITANCKICFQEKRKIGIYLPPVQCIYFFILVFLTSLGMFGLDASIA